MRAPSASHGAPSLGLRFTPSARFDGSRWTWRPWCRRAPPSCWWRHGASAPARRVLRRVGCGVSLVPPCWGGGRGAGEGGWSLGGRPSDSCFLEGMFLFLHRGGGVFGWQRGTLHKPQTSVMYVCVCAGKTTAFVRASWSAGHISQPIMLKRSTILARGGGGAAYICIYIFHICLFGFMSKNLGTGLQGTPCPRHKGVAEFTQALLWRVPRIFGC